MSEEGLMTDDIEDCMNGVIESPTKGDVLALDVVAWCTTMLGSDRMGFIARKHLEAMSQRVQTATAR